MDETYLKDEQKILPDEYIEKYKTLASNYIKKTCFKNPEDLIDFILYTFGNIVFYNMSVLFHIFSRAGMDIQEFSEMMSAVYNEYIIEFAQAEFEHSAEDLKLKKNLN